MTFLNEEEPGSKKTPIHLLDDKIDEVLLKSRRVFLCDAVTNESAKEIIRKMWFLESSDPGKPILFIINSPGGSVDAGFAVWDQIQMISSPVTTLITGLAASMGSVLSLCAKPGRRFATPHARIMIHQPSIHGVVKGQATDLKIQAEEIIRTRKALVEKYVAATGQNSATIEKALDRDTWMSAQEALAFGLLDKVVTSNKDLGV